MNRRNISMAQAMHPTKVLFDRLQRDTLSHGHHLLVTHEKRRRELSNWFLTGYPGSSWA